MPIEITMPQLSDTMTEGTLVKWFKKEGDKVKAGEQIADVETDKATMPMEVSESGTVACVLAAEGQKVKVGDLLAVVATGKEDPADVKKKYQTAAAIPPKAATPLSTPIKVPVPGLAGMTLEGAAAGEVHESASVGHGATREAPTAVPPMPHRGGNGHRMFASPLARRIAEDKGINLAEIRGSGPNGRIVQKDVLSFTPAAASESPPIAPGQTQVIPMTKMRTAIATALQRSKQAIPHFYESIDIDVEQALKLRESMNRKLEKEKLRLSIADFITRAVALSLEIHPALNARFNAEKNEVTRFGDVNLGIAVSIPDGLIVPVLRGVNYLGLKEIRRRSSDLIDRARQQKLKREEMSEGTFTISSLGTSGIKSFSAIINPPEVAILAVGSAEKRAVVVGDEIVARNMLMVTLSADHRVVDGAVAAAFLMTFKQFMEEPGMMLV
jgi:pyruvate dehydrogenase E2 component (dihydrolipoamide acetyltransferase)